MAKDDSGIVRRGLMLFAFVAAIVIVLLVIIFRRPGGPLPRTEEPTEALVGTVANPGMSFPGAINWASVHQLKSTLPSPPGWETRYNATVALARRGSPRVPLDIVLEMLDERRQMRNCRVQLPNGTNVANETQARKTVLTTLKALRMWHQHPEAVQVVGRDDPQLRQVYRAVDRLLQSENRVVRTEAKNTKLALEAEPGA